jgi:hypothetical protein
VRELPACFSVPAFDFRPRSSSPVLERSSQEMQRPLRPHSLALAKRLQALWQPEAAAQTNRQPWRTSRCKD